MILGNVSARREAVIQLVVLHESKQTKFIDAVIDTGYTGDLMLPKSIIEALRLPLIGTQDAILGDDSKALFEIYDGTVIWDGEIKGVDINASDVSVLVGMGLLENFKLEVEGKPMGQVRITALG